MNCPACLRKEHKKGQSVIGKRFLVDATKKNKNTSLWQYIDLQPVSGTIEVQVDKKPKQPKRTATCEMRFGEVDYTPPYRYPEARSDELSPIKIFSVC